VVAAPDDALVLITVCDGVLLSSADVRPNGLTRPETSICGNAIELSTSARNEGLVKILSSNRIEEIFFNKLAISEPAIGAAGAVSPIVVGLSPVVVDANVPVGCFDGAFFIDPEKYK
jgi:hypothetical protein